jgi:vitamin B12 transporter
MNQKGCLTFPKGLVNSSMEHREHSSHLKRSWNVAVLVASTAVSASAAAVPPSVESLPTYVVVATRTPLSLDRVSPSVSYLSMEDMEFWQDRSLTDSLSRLPGVAFWSNGTPGSLTSLSIRGSESNHTSFFLDGRRLNPGFGNQYDLESLSTQNLSSLQVQSGASSVNYGASGIGGTVALQSQNTLGGEGLSGGIRGELGANNHQSVSANTLYSTGRWGLSAGATTLSTDNERRNDRFTRNAAQLRLDRRLVGDLTFELVGQYSDAEKGAPGLINNPKPDDQQWTTNWLISPGIRYATDVVSAHFFYARSESLLENDVEDFFGSIYQTENKVDSDEVSMQVDSTLTNEALLTFGGVYRNDAASNPNLNAFSTLEPVEPYDNRFEQAGFWAQLQWRLSKAFEFRAGLRYDVYTDYDSSVNGSLEAIYTLSESGSLFAKIASSYAPPSALDLAFDEDQMLVADGLGGEIIVHNRTDLNPEESVSYELGFKHSFMEEDLQLAIVLFRNEIDELITFVSFSDRSFNFGSDTLNVEEATTEGVELSIDYAASEEIDFGLGYTYLTATNQSEDKRLAYRPRHQLQVTVTYRPLKRLSLGLSALGHFGRERGQFNQPNLDVEDYLQVNMVAEWTINDHWQLFGRVGNLLDEAYAPVFGYPALGRAGYIGARLDF